MGKSTIGIHTEMAFMTVLSRDLTAIGSMN